MIFGPQRKLTKANGSPALKYPLAPLGFWSVTLMLCSLSCQRRLRTCGNIVSCPGGILGLVIKEAWTWSGKCSLKPKET